MTTPWPNTAGAFPAMNAREDTQQSRLRVVAREKAEYAALLQHHQGDFLLLSLVLIFLVGSYLVCRYCRCRWLHKSSKLSQEHDTDAPNGHAYTMYTSNGNSQPPKKKKKFVLESVTSSHATISTHPTKTTKPKTMLVSEMEQPFLGPPDYEQPPAYELSPPAYEYLPSAPPLSDDAEHSPKTL